ncbi:MAG: hypothetical protein LUE90_07060 [Clostridiales bacterium]|nr:hypothetical protein [Clostridiales bacterium]
MKKKLSKWRRKILMTAVSLGLVLGVRSNTELHEGWSMAAWADTVQTSLGNAVCEATVSYTLGASSAAVTVTVDGSDLTAGTDYTPDALSGTVYTDDKQSDTVTLTDITDTTTTYYYYPKAETSENDGIDLLIPFTATYKNTGTPDTEPITPTTSNSLFTVSGTSFDTCFYVSGLTIALTDQSGYYIAKHVLADFGTATSADGVHAGDSVYIKNALTGEISGYTVAAGGTSVYTKDDTEPDLTAEVSSAGWTSEYKTISVTVSDAVSGIKNNKVYYSDRDILSGITSITTESEFSDKMDGVSSVELTDNGSGSYTGTITIEEEADSIGKIWYIYVFDGAGNLATESLTVNKADRTVPTAALTYPGGQEGSDSSNNYFYRRADSSAYYETATLVYTEKNYAENVSGGEVVYPTISYSTDGGENYEAISAVVTQAPSAAFHTPALQWTLDPTGGTMTATVYLPYSSGAEIAYTLKTFYTDVSGNLLTSAADGGSNLTGSAGEYTGVYTMVLDDRAPVLTSFSIDGVGTKYLSDSTTVAYAKIGSTGSALAWTIDDYDSYWDKTAVTVTVYKRAAGQTGFEIYQTADYSEITWTDEGSRQHKAEYAFAGDTDGAATYYISVSYKDRAANEMTQGAAVTEGSCTDGTYASAEFILDYAAPVFTVEYSEAYQIVDAGGNTGSGLTPATGYTAYYGSAEQSIDATVTFAEHYAAEEYTGGDLTGLTDFALTVTGSEAGAVTPSDIKWSSVVDPSGCITIYTVTFTLTAEDYYTLSIDYTDAAGNAMTAGSVVEGANAVYTGGACTSETLVLDTTAPEISGVYSSTAVNTRDGRDYFNMTDTALTLTVTDRNIRDLEMVNAMSGDNAYLVGAVSDNIFQNTDVWTYLVGLTGATVHTSEALTGTAYGTTYTIPLSTEANYDLSITGYVDLARNAALIDSSYNSYVCVDAVSPTDVNFTYSVTSTAGWWPVNYKNLGYAFANATLTVTASAEDAASGIKSFIFYVTDEDGKVTTIPVDNITPVSSSSASITVPLDGSDFKGSVRVVVSDWSANTTEKSEGQIVESASRFASAGSAVITTITNPSRTVNGVDYYNTDVTFNLTMQESYSGLRSYAYTAGSGISESYDYAKAAGTDLTAVKTDEITYSFTKDITIPAPANNANDVSVNASYVSNTGYTESVSQTYNIDITKPTIQVTWDNNNTSNATYYNASRTATVVITERNFDPDDVVFTITNTDGVMPTISGWSASGNGDATTHTATVTFSADGDYTFTLAFRDLAGNKADYTTVDEFTVDQTNPAYTVTYDNTSAQNSYYYDANRVAAIDVYEHNFDVSAVTVIVTRDGSTVTPVMSGWTTNGDHHIATVSFSADGEYTFTIAGMDMAANTMDDYTQDHFVVDTQEPKIEIFNVEDSSANNGEVMPGVRCSDTNYDANSTVVQVDGYYNGLMTPETASRTVTDNSVEIVMEDFAYTQDMDDMYTLTATACDLAGNSSEATIVFSVNRFGSVYTFDDATEDLVGGDGSYYTNEEPTIVVIETNVDTLEESDIAKSLNGDLTTMTEDSDYTVKSSGSEVSWKQYTYTLSADNFESEGEYILTFTSTDRAANSNTNSAKVAFVVDKTAPTVLVSGVEENGQYRQDSMDISISASDNVRMACVTVTNDEESEVYDYETVTDGAFTYTMNSKNTRQTLVVTATDAAGNESAFMSLVDADGNLTEAAEVQYLLTTNLWIQFRSNKVLVAVSITGIAAAAAVIWWFLFGKKRKDFFT